MLGVVMVHGFVSNELIVKWFSTEILGCDSQGVIGAIKYITIQTIHYIV